jgi:hypothetical protein
MRTLYFVATMTVALPVYADPKFEFGKSEELEKVKEIEWTAAAEVGLVFTTGNSDTTSISAGFRASRKTGKNKLAVEGSLIYAKSSVLVLNDMNDNGTIDNQNELTTLTTTTAETFASKVRYDRFLTKFNSVYAAALFARDLPAGKEAVVTAQVGYSRQVYKTEKAEAVAEAGIDFSRENLVTGDPINIVSARGFLGYKAVMTEGTNLDAAIELLTNVNHEDLATRADGADFGEDTRLTAKVAISAKIGADLAVQTSFELRYDNRPAPLLIKGLAEGFVPEASSLDTIMKASLIYTFF